jgi:hypothetical protein
MLGCSDTLAELWRSDVEQQFSSLVGLARHKSWHHDKAIDQTSEIALLQPGLFWAESGFQKHSSILEEQS